MVRIVGRDLLRRNLDGARGRTKLATTIRRTVIRAWTVALGQTMPHIHPPRTRTTFTTPVSVHPAEHRIEICLWECDPVSCRSDVLNEQAGRGQRIDDLRG